jgi:hypothetical protein
MITGVAPMHLKRPTLKVLYKAIVSTKFTAQNLDSTTVSHVLKGLWLSLDSHSQNAVYTARCALACAPNDAQRAKRCAEKFLKRTVKRFGKLDVGAIP